jgi:protein-S-isoprenylcysteine O-methyltransferase Ste14
VNLPAALFRYRVAVMVLLHVIGFFTPWDYFTGGSHGTLWLAASTWLGRTGWLSLEAATLTVTLLGLACLLMGTLLRLWGTAHLGAHIMRGTAMQGDQLVAAGPYAYLRNPLYLGTWFISLATALLMPPDGALLFLVAYSGFLLFLIAAEETFLANRLGETYMLYRQHVPRLLPNLHRKGSAPAEPDWLRAMLHETYPIGFTLCFAIFAWRYNARILIQCLLICYGFSLVMRALTGTVKDTTSV